MMIMSMKFLKQQFIFLQISSTREFWEYNGGELEKGIITASASYVSRLFPPLNSSVGIRMPPRLLNLSLALLNLHKKKKYSEAKFHL